MATINSPIGIVLPVPMNEWNAKFSYEKLNIVTYKNSTFIAKQSNMGIEPLVSPGWQNIWMPLLSGVGIASTTVEYANGSISSSAMPPQDGWNAQIPAFQAGELLWTRVTITYTDSTTAVFYSVGVTFAPIKTSQLDNDGNGTSPFATEAFTNSSINNIAAFYITYNAENAAFPSKAALTGALTFYNGGKPRIPTQNDYAIVLADESQAKGVDGKYPTTRYSYQGGTYPDGQWSFQYIVNNISLTQAQVDAINSGINSADVAQIRTNKSNITKLMSYIKYYFTEGDEQPKDLFGGTWEELPEGTFIRAAGSGGQAGQTGGNATVSLTAENNGPHNHDIYVYTGANIGGEVGTSPAYGYVQVTATKPGDPWTIYTGGNYAGRTAANGGGTPFSIIPPYRTTHIWRKIS